MKLFLKIFLIILFCISLNANHELKKVSLQLQWKYQFQFAGYIIAKEKGFYKNKNLDVDIKEWKPGIKVVDNILHNNTNYAIARPTVLIDISKGKEIVLLSAIFQSSPLCLVTTKESGIKSIKEFTNKRIMSSGDMNTDASLISMLFSQGINLQKDMIIQAPTFNVKDLLNKKTDLITSYISNEPYLLKELGSTPIIFSPKDYGFDFYNDILVTSQKYLEKNPQEVKFFNQASLAGWEYAFSHINETVDIIYNKYNTQHKSKQALLYEAKELKKLAYYHTKYIGDISKSKIENIFTTYKLLGLVSNEINYNKFIYNLNNTINLTKEEKQWINTNTINVGVSPWYPITYVDEKTKKVSGVGIDILEEVMRSTGLKVKFIPKQWSNLIDDFKNHKIDLLPTTYYTKNRETFGDYTQSYMDIQEYLYVKNNSKIKSFKDLKDHSIAMVKAYGTIDKIKLKYPDIKIIEVDSLEETVKMLLNGNVDAIFNTQFSIDNFIKSHFINGLRAIYQTDFKPSKLHYFTNNNKPILNKILRKAIEQINEDKKNKIINNWIVNQNIFDKSDYLTIEEQKYINSHKIIKMCNNPNWAPIEFAQNGDMTKINGIAIDTLKIIEHKLDIKFINIPTKNWEESQEFLRDKKCDILPSAIATENRKKYANFTKPYLKLPLAIFMRKDKQIVSSLDEIMDKTWARQKGSGLITKLRKDYPNMKVIETESYSDSLIEVNNGNVDFTIATLPVASHNINKYLLHDLQIVGYTTMMYNLSIAIRNDNKILLSILDKTLENIPQNISKEIYKKWVSKPVQESVLDYKLLVYAFIFIVIIISILLYKQYIMNNSIKDFSELIDATMEGIFLFRNGICIDANRSALDIFGYDNKKEVIGRKSLSFVSEQSKDITSKNIIKDDAKSYESIMIKKDGSKFHALLRGYNLKNKNVRLSSIIDITNLKKQEKLISEQSKLVAMGEMIGNIAHQWRQPLSVISTSATGMLLKNEMGMIDKDTIDKTCNIINENAQYLSKTIDDFKNFVKGNEKAVLFNLNKNFESFLHLVEGSIKKADIKIIKDIDTNLNIKNLDNQLIQCYINIINNSRDAFEQNNIKNRYIFIDMHKDDLDIIINIKDNAGGIPDKYINKVFEPYFTTKHESQGTGIGLNMTYKLIKDGMNGDITVWNENYKYNNEDQNGANFKIILPYKNEE